MDAVILAAGKGSRLDGHVPPYFKPLVTVDGLPLIRHAVDIAIRNTTRVIVVAAPENAHLIAQVLDTYGDGVHIVVQRHARGPGHALRVGLVAVTSDDVVVMMGDNTFSYGCLDKIVRTPSFAVAVKYINVDECERFTRLRPTGMWVEKTSTIELDAYDHGMACVWIGPFKTSVVDLQRAFETWCTTADEDVEIPIGPLFNFLGTPKLVPSDALDIGVPEMLP